MNDIAGLKKVHSLLEQESKNLLTLEEQLHNMKKGKVRRFFHNSFEKEQYKLKRTSLTGQIQTKRSFIEDETEKLENAAICDVHILTSFITKTLSIIKGVVYDEWDFRFDSDDYDYVHLIAPKNVCEQIARLYCAGELYDLDDIVFFDDEDKKIDLVQFELYDYCDELDIYDIERQDVPEVYDENKNLSDMLLRLVEVKYKNPSFSDEEAADEVIRQLSFEHSSDNEIGKINVHKKA